jgi:hypothetical protein
VKPVAGQGEVARVPSLIKVSEYVADAPDLVGPHPARIIAPEKAFQPLVAKRPHHKNTVPRIGTGVNRNSDGLVSKPIVISEYLGYNVAQRRMESWLRVRLFAPALMSARRGKLRRP